MKILLISDIESKYLWDYFNFNKFKDIDLVISCGDLKAQYMSYLVTVLKVPLLYIHGNHDGEYLDNPPEGCECIDGKFIKFKELRIVALGGSKRYNQGLFQYTENQMRGRIRKLSWKIWRNKGFDILVTHSGAFGIGDDTDKCHEGFQCFNELLDKFKPKYFFHGHSHLNYGNNQRIIKYNETTVINAYGYHVVEL